MRTNRSTIVTFTAWLLIVGAVLALVQVTRVHGGERWSSLVGTGVNLALGVGLLLRLNWARWLMLGASLLGWTVGSLLGLWAVAELIHSGVVVGAIIAAVVLGAIILLCFRLFERLNSPEGREEFNAPETERRAVFTSTAVNLAWYALAALLSQPWLLGVGRSPREEQVAAHDALERAMAARAEDLRKRQEQSAAEAPARPSEAEIAERQRQIDEGTAAAIEAHEARVRAAAAAAEHRSSEQQEYHRKVRELFDRRMRDRLYTDAQFEADQQRLQREFERGADVPPPGTQRITETADDAGERASSKILKCRDASGAVSFTQGYCPPGSTRVD